MARIENVETGLGNDRVIGNDYNNMIVTGAGDDNISLVAVWIL